MSAQALGLKCGTHISCVCGVYTNANISIKLWSTHIITLSDAPSLPRKLRLYRYLISPRYYENRQHIPCRRPPPSMYFWSFTLVGIAVGRGSRKSSHYNLHSLFFFRNKCVSSTKYLLLYAHSLSVRIRKVTHIVTVYDHIRPQKIIYDRTRQSYSSVYGVENFRITPYFYTISVYGIRFSPFRSVYGARVRNQCTIPVYLRFSP